MQQFLEAINIYPLTAFFLALFILIIVGLIKSKS